MLRNHNGRRIFAALLAILGAALIFLAPETRAGAWLLALGVSVEVVGIAIRKWKRAGRKSREHPG